MARTVVDTNFKTRESRLQLDPEVHHWRELSPGEHLGYRRRANAPAGYWVHRSRPPKGKYTQDALGTADDILDANNVTVFSWDQAQKKIQARIDARAKVEGAAGPRDPLTVTVKQCWDYHEAALAAEGKVSITKRYYADNWRELWDIAVMNKSLGTKIREWMTRESKTPKRISTGKGKPHRHAPASDDPEVLRRRRSTVNTYLSMLLASLNRAFDEDIVTSNASWRHVKPFRQTDGVVQDIYTAAEVRTLIAHAEPEVVDLIMAAVLTGGRYSSLAALQASDFDERAGTLRFRKSKTKSYVIHLSPEGIKFFKKLCARRRGHKLLLVRPPWGKRKNLPWTRASEARYHLERTCKAAGVRYLSFHAFRRTHISLAIMEGKLSLDLAAKALGHTTTKMVQKHYAHYREDHVARITRHALPHFGFKI
jgi:integrase